VRAAPGFSPVGRLMMAIQPRSRLDWRHCSRSYGIDCRSFPAFTRGARQ